MNEKEMKKVVQDGYAKVAQATDATCCKSFCCQNSQRAESISKNIGYSEEELRSAPEGSNLGLGCGNPIAIAILKEGETVLDLGSGPGFDCFLAANKVGLRGKVIGVDMTAQMIEKASQNAEKGGYSNVEFRLGEIEHLPVEDNSIDVIISNCVINLSPEKKKVFKEAHRVLRPGGRFIISDIVLLKELPRVIKNSVEAYVGCLSGAVKKDEYLSALQGAGFDDVKIISQAHLPIELIANDITVQKIMKNLNLTEEMLKILADSAVSIQVYGRK